MQVTLLNHTPEPEKSVEAFARVCYSSKSPSDLWEADSLTPRLNRGAEARAQFIKRLIDSGHLSPLEHVLFNFGIEGISRACSHQLVRHRIASYSQQSQRYVSQAPQFVLPPSLQEDEEARAIYEAEVNRAFEKYQELVKRGLPKEDARYLLPQAVSTNIVVSMNARELRHFFQLRLCSRAQWEIRELARRMLEEVKKVAPALFEESGPLCETGSCRDVCEQPVKK